jgi:glutathione S-transferase
MKLIGSYTSPFVRKISILLLEKGITFEFVNELPYNADSGVARYNPLGKVPRWSPMRVSTGLTLRSSQNT